MVGLCFMYFGRGLVSGLISKRSMSFVRRVRLIGLQTIVMSVAIPIFTSGNRISTSFFLYFLNSAAILAWYGFWLKSRTIRWPDALIRAVPWMPISNNQSSAHRRVMPLQHTAHYGGDDE